MRKPGSKTAREEVLAPHLQHLRGGQAALQHVGDAAGVDAGLGAQHERLGDGLDDDADDDLVADLDDLAGAGRTAVDDGPAHHLEDRPCALEGGLRATDHDGERAGDGALVAAADGSIERLRTGRRGTLGEVARVAGCDGAHVDGQPARAEGLEGAVGAEVDLLHLRGIGQHRDEHVGVGGDLGGAAAGAGALSDQRLQRGLGTTSSTVSS